MFWSTSWSVFENGVYYRIPAIWLNMAICLEKHDEPVDYPYLGFGKQPTDVVISNMK